MEYVRWLNIMTNQTTALCVYSVLNGRLIFDWLFENMNPDMSDPIQNVVRCLMIGWSNTNERLPDMTPYRMLLVT
jgi:hypothetical protein